MRFTCIEEVILAVARAVDFYNNERPHMSINMMSGQGWTRFARVVEVGYI